MLIHRVGRWLKRASSAAPPPAAAATIDSLQLLWLIDDCNWIHTLIDRYEQANPWIPSVIPWIFTHYYYWNEWLFNWSSNFKFINPPQLRQRHQRPQQQLPNWQPTSLLIDIELNYRSWLEFGLINPLQRVRLLPSWIVDSARSRLTERV